MLIVGGAEGAFEEGAEVAFGEAEGGADAGGADVFGDVVPDIVVGAADEEYALRVAG